jgi:hypothetical protein
MSNDHAHVVNHCPNDCFSLAGDTIVGEFIDPQEHLKRQINTMGECPKCGAATEVEWR